MVDSGAQGLRNRRLLLEAMRSVGFDHRHAKAFMTHSHFDHAELFCEVLGFSTPLYMSEVAFRRRGTEDAGLQGLFIRRLRAMGVSLDDACSYAAANSESAKLEKRSLNMRFVDEGDTVDVGSLSFRVVRTPGHTADHLALFDAGTGILFSGDAALEDTAPSLDSQPGIEDGVERYLRTLEELRGLSVAYAFPGHGDVLEGPRATRSGAEGERGIRVSSCAASSFHGVIEANVAKKQAKLKRVYDAVASAPFANGQQIARMLLRCEDGNQWREHGVMSRYYALLEAFMMLQHLMAEGKVLRLLDDYGVYRYVPNRNRLK